MLHVHSSSFPDQGEIPRQFTCEGDDRPPSLEWTDMPPGTRSLAILVEDPDAPDPAHPQRTFVHWVVYNVPPDRTGITDGRLPAQALEGKNDWGRTGYGGPCPPIGRHRYFHRVYALDTVLPDLGKPTKAELIRAMEGHILGEAAVVGTYEKHDQPRH